MVELLIIYQPMIMNILLFRVLLKPMKLVTTTLFVSSQFNKNS